MSFKPSRLPYEEFKKIYSKVPRLCVDLIFKNDRGILLIERAIEPLKGSWHFPGGTILMGETVDRAIARIAESETNLSVRQARLIGYMEFSEPDNPVFHTISMVFEIEQYSGEIKGGDEGRNIHFHQNPPNKMIPEHRQFLLENRMMRNSDGI